MATFRRLPCLGRQIAAAPQDAHRIESRRLSAELEGRIVRVGSRESDFETERAAPGTASYTTVSARSSGASLTVSTSSTRRPSGTASARLKVERREVLRVTATGGGAVEVEGKVETRRSVEQPAIVPQPKVILKLSSWMSNPLIRLSRFWDVCLPGTDIVLGRYTTAMPPIQAHTTLHLGSSRMTRTGSGGALSTHF